MADFVATHRLTEAASLKMLAAGVAKANELGCKVSLAVADQSCRLIAFLMMDGRGTSRSSPRRGRRSPRPRSASRPAMRRRRTR